jgi:sialate O-acetylesterase
MRCRELFIVLAVVLADVLWMPLTTKGDVTPHALISNGVVLQRDRAVNVWGTADRGEVVTVRFRGRESLTTTGGDGQWRLQVESQQAGGPFPLTIAGKNTIALNVWVGDV